MAKELEKCQTGFTTSMCTMIWEIQTRVITWLDQDLVVKQFHTQDDAVLVAFQWILVSQVLLP
jgi:hypothetical protein